MAVVDGAGLDYGQVAALVEELAGLRAENARLLRLLDRVITAVHRRFDTLSRRGRGLVAGPAPKDLSELVRSYGDSLDTVRAHGPLTEEQAFAGRR